MESATSRRQVAGEQTSVTAPIRPGWRKRLAFSIALLICLVLVAEGTLQVLTRLSRPVYAMLSLTPVGIAIPDRSVGWRGNPEYPEHDQLGFRNRDVPASATVVALGDSQTYGTSVGASESWPAWLERLGTSRTYDLAFPGWGPPQNSLMLDEALAFKPRVVVQALFTGNDLIDSYTFVYHRKRLPRLRSTDPKALDRIAAAEREDPWDDYSLADQRPEAADPDRKPPRPPSNMAEYVLQNSRLYGLANAVSRAYNYRLRHPYRPGENEESDPLKDDDYLHFNNGQIKTILAPSYRLPAVDLEDPRVEEGLRITLQLYSEMKERAEAAGARFAIVLIPTKELVFKPVADEYLSIMPRVYVRLARGEDAVRTRMRDQLALDKVPFADATPALRALVDEGIAPYSIDDDGHLSPAGQRAVAELVQATLLSDGG